MTEVFFGQLLSGRHPFFVPGEDNQETVKQKILSGNLSTDGPEWYEIGQKQKNL